MKGRHQFRRRFSLQPSFMKEEHEEEKKHHRAERTEDTVPNSANLTNNAVRHKIVVLGAAKVGKSSLITQFLYGAFSTKYKRTIEEMHHGDFNVSGVRLTLDILDTSGSYEFPAMRTLSMQSADAFILVYDITDANSFSEVRALRDQIHETKQSTAVPIVVVGNKVDLAETGARQDFIPTTLKEQEGKKSSGNLKSELTTSIQKIKENISNLGQTTSDNADLRTKRTHGTRRLHVAD